VLQPIHVTFCALIMYELYIYSVVVRTTIYIHRRIDGKKIAILSKYSTGMHKSKLSELMKREFMALKTRQVPDLFMGSDSDLVTVEEG